MHAHTRAPTPLDLRVVNDMEAADGFVGEAITAIGALWTLRTLIKNAWNVAANVQPEGSEG